MLPWPARFGPASPESAPSPNWIPRNETIPFPDCIFHVAGAGASCSGAFICPRAAGRTHGRAPARLPRCRLRRCRAGREDRQRRRVQGDAGIFRTDCRAYSVVARKRRARCDGGRCAEAGLDGGRQSPCTSRRRHGFAPALGADCGIPCTCGARDRARAVRSTGVVCPALCVLPWRRGAR